MIEEEDIEDIAFHFGEDNCTRIAQILLVHVIHWYPASSVDFMLLGHVTCNHKSKALRIFSSFKVRARLKMRVNLVFAVK
jgi:hypothetical protein